MDYNCNNKCELFVNIFQIYGACCGEKERAVGSNIVGEQFHRVLVCILMKGSLSHTWHKRSETLRFGLLLAFTLWVCCLSSVRNAQEPLSDAQAHRASLSAMGRLECGASQKHLCISINTHECTLHRGL